MNRPFFNPVPVVFSDNLSEGLPPLLRGRRAAVLTTRGMVARGSLRPLEGLLGEKGVEVIGMFRSFPDPEMVLSVVREIVRVRPEVLVAVGGGSVLDGAKVAAFLAPMTSPEDWVSRFCVGEVRVPEDIPRFPVIAVPTTSGTGSEVTPWSVLWDREKGEKISFGSRALYPEAALLIPSLTETLTYENTLIPALDAFSQAMEAVWNRNANPVSDALAFQAITLLNRLFGNHFQETYGHSGVRGDLQLASLLSGLSFSNTATAMAHALSYPLTGKLGIPHGLACSFTLPEILRFNAVAKERISGIVASLGCSGSSEAVERVLHLFKKLGVGALLKRFVIGAETVRNLKTPFLSSSRALNNIIPFTEEDAMDILCRSCENLCHE